MKKMVCEICGSSNIRKESGIFKCLECGTEYSLEEARSLLVEVGEEAKVEQTTPAKEAQVLSAPQDKEKLVNVLHAWYEYALSCENVTKYFIHFCRSNEIKSLWEYTPEEVEVLRVKYVPELTVADFDKKVRLTPVNEWDKYIRFQYDSGSGNKMTALYPTMAFDSFLTGNLNYDYLNNFLQPQANVIKEMCRDETVNNVHTHRECQILRKSNKKLLGGVDPRRPLLSELIYQLITVQQIPFDDIEVVVHEYKSWNETIEEKHSLFSKPTYKRLAKTSERDYVAPVANEVLGYIKKAYDYMDAIKQFHKEQYDFFVKNSVEIKKEFNTLLAQEGTYVKIFDLPLKYRSSSAIAALIELLYIGRADSWKEALNLYETDKFQARVLNGLSSINSSLGRINSTLIMGFNYLGRKLDITNEQLNRVIDNTSRSLEVSQSIANGLERIEKQQKYLDFHLSLDTTIKVITNISIK